jgi:hypothetical protein
MESTVLATHLTLDKGLGSEHRLSKETTAPGRLTCR